MIREKCMSICITMLRVRPNQHPKHIVHASVDTRHACLERPRMEHGACHHGCTAANFVRRETTPSIILTRGRKPIPAQVPRGG